MSSGIQPVDLGFFSVLARAGSLSAAARELGITTPAVSKHLALMESRVGVSLVNRTTRRMSLTPEGELYLTSLVAERMVGRWYLAMLHRAGEVATPRLMERLGSVFPAELAETMELDREGSMAYVVARAAA